MPIERIVMGFAGLVNLVGLALGRYVSPWWFLLSAFVGLNLFQAFITGFCPLAIFLKAVGLKPGAMFR